MLCSPRELPGGEVLVDLYLLFLSLWCVLGHTQASVLLLLF